MNTNQYYNYEDFIIDLDAVIDILVEAIQNSKPLSLARFGHGELAYIGGSDFSEWKKAFEPHSLYAGATALVTKIQNDLVEALRTTDIVGLHASWG